MRRILFWSMLFILGCGVLADTASAQCAMCVTGLTQSPEGRNMARNFNRAILFLLTIPYLIVGTFAVLLLHRRARIRNTSLWNLVRSRFTAWLSHRQFPRKTVPS